MELREFMGFRVSYREHTTDEGVVRYSIEGDIFFAALPWYHPHADDVIIDIGAHIGAFSLLAASKAKDGHVYAVEPCKESYEYLERNVLLNALSNVSTYRLALFGEKGAARLYYHPKDNSGHTITKMLSSEYEEVQMTTLEDFMRSANIDRCDLMKLNCEGAEFGIILNTPREVLERIRILLVLYHLDLATGDSEQHLVHHLNKCGFYTTITNRSRQRGWIIARNAFRTKIGELFLYSLLQFGFIGRFSLACLNRLHRLMRPNYRDIARRDRPEGLTDLPDQTSCYVPLLVDQDEGLGF